jgi:hypothetical protein
MLTEWPEETMPYHQDFTLISIWLIGLVAVAVILVAVKALRRMLATDAAEPPEVTLDKRYAAGEVSLKHYRDQKDKLLRTDSLSRSQRQLANEC